MIKQTVASLPENVNGSQPEATGFEKAKKNVPIW
jgi:hypothetical protein